MVRSILTETRSILFDMSPVAINGIYNEDRKAAEKLVALVMVTAAKYGPSIIYIDEVEKVFPGKKKKKKGEKKKKKKEKDKNDPTRIKKALVKWVKKKFLNDETNVTLIGCTNEPEAGSKKEFAKFFKNSIYFPFPDYTTRRLMWRTFIESTVNKALEQK